MQTAKVLVSWCYRRTHSKTKLQNNTKETGRSKLERATCVRAAWNTHTWKLTAGDTHYTHTHDWMYLTICSCCCVCRSLTDHVTCYWSRDWLLITWLLTDHVTGYWSCEFLLIAWLLTDHVTSYWSHDFLLITWLQHIIQEVQEVQYTRTL